MQRSAIRQVFLASVCTARKLTPLVLDGGASVTVWTSEVDRDVKELSGTLEIVGPTGGRLVVPTGAGTEAEVGAAGAGVEVGSPGAGAEVEIDTPSGGSEVGVVGVGNGTGTVSADDEGNAGSTKPGIPSSGWPWPWGLVPPLDPSGRPPSGGPPSSG